MSKVVSIHSHSPTPSEKAFYIQVSSDLLDPAISDRAFRLYVHLQSFCKGTHNQCWPSQSLLAERTGWSERNIRRLLDELAQYGAITIHPPKPPLRSHNIYELHILPTQLNHRTLESSPPDSRVLPTGQILQTHRTLESYESHVETHDCVREPDPDSVLTATPEATNPAPINSGYVALLQQAGLASRATELARLIPADRGEEWLKAWIDYPDRRGPGMLVNAIKQNWDVPAPKAKPDAPQSPRNREKPRSGHKVPVGGFDSWKQLAERQARIDQSRSSEEG